MKLNPKLSFRQDEPAVALIFADDGTQICAVNGAGITLWKALAAGADKAGLIAALKSKFADLPDDGKIERDVDSFLDDLRKKEFLLEDENETV